jgi:transposase-like protein
LPTKIEFTAEDREAAWAMYATRPDLTVRAIAAHFGVSVFTLRRRIKQWNWPPRLEALAPARREAARRLEGLEPGLSNVVPFRVAQAAAADDAHAPLDLARVAQALGRNALQQLDSLEAAVARGEADPERAARTLASLSRTLAAARALEHKGGGSVDDDAEPARSLEDIRQELARHLDRLVAEEGLERRFGFDDPEGVGETA